MAFNLSPRWTAVVSQTSEKLAPNYYDISSGCNRKQNYAPFLSNNKRSTTTYNKQWTTALYDARVPVKIRGGASMQSRTKRVTYDLKKMAEAPGPAAYDPGKTRGPFKPPPRAKKLYVCNVPFHSEAKGPSIPTRIDENGYSFDAAGWLVKNPPDACDTSMGPAYYHVYKETLTSKDLYGGCRWSASKTVRRTMEAANNHPGPGDYDIAGGRYNPVAEAAEEYREMARAFSFVPRTLEQMQRRLEREDLPGPASYNLQRTANAQRINTLSAFGNSGERFRETVSDNPAPTEYTLTPAVHVKRVSRSPGAFNSKTNRFKSMKIVKTNAPGPASYNIPSAMARRQRLRYTFVPFDSSAPRMVEDDGDAMPGPGDYMAGESATHVNDVPRKTAIFQSQLPRFKHAVEKYPTANAASYNISKDFNNAKDRRSFLRVEVGFAAKALAHDPFRPREGPSPCDYRAHEAVAPRGYYLPVVPRDCDVSDTPGPGSYNIHPSIATSMYAAINTRNIRLKENATGARLRVPPQKTRDEWNRERRKRRMLKAFDRPEALGMESWMDL